MNREDIIRMAQEAKFATEEWGDGLHHVCVFNFQGSETEITEELERFASLVASAERDKHKWDIHSCSPTCNRYACVATREAVLAEREACAKLCEEQYEYYGHDHIFAKAIRARGQA
jgi:hypothetical protein